MAAEARFHDACDALRAKLREMKGHTHNSGTEPSAVGLAALRVVLQHSCQADQAVLSARPDAPDRCFVVTCDASASANVFTEGVDEHCAKIIYAPALISNECAWRRLVDCAEETKAAIEFGVDQEWHGNRKLIVYDDYDGTYEFSVAIYEFDDDPPLQDIETFLDLRTLKSLRVVVGMDALCDKMFSAVVALRKVKMPRTLYAETPGDDWDDFDFEDLRVSKSVGALEDKFSTFRRFPADVLKLAAKVNVTWSLLPQPRPPSRFSGDLEAHMKRAASVARNIPCDTALRFMERRYTTHTHIANEHRWVRATVRPLPLVDQADSLAVWVDESLFEQARRELDAAAELAELVAGPINGIY